MTVTTEGPEGWAHKDEWKKRGQDFMVVVSRHCGPTTIGEGPHRWCVYAYIYPKHPHFTKFDGPNMWQEAATMLAMHGGPTLLEYPQYDGDISSVKVGCDYNHIYDDHYTHYATASEAHTVFQDAEDLYEQLTNIAKREAA